MALTLTAETPSVVLPSAGRMAQAALRVGIDSMAEKKAARFPRAVRLLRHADFQRVYKQGRRHFSTTMTVFYFARPQVGVGDDTASCKARAGVPAGVHVGFTVGRVLGGAVERNRMKRRLREAVRLTLPLDALAVDIVINPKKTILAADFTDVVREVERALAVIAQKLGTGSASDLKGRVSRLTHTRAGVPAPHGSVPRKS